MNDEPYFGNLDDKPKRKRPPGKPMRWHEVWLAVYTRPSTATFEAILADPTARPPRAYLWVILTSTLVAVVNILLPQQSYWSASSAGVPTLLCSLLMVGVFALVGLVIAAGVVHIIAKIYGGRGVFDDMIYVYGAITAPYGLVVAAFSLMNLSPGLWSLVALCLPLYSFMLVVLALKAVHGFSTGRAVAVALTPSLVFVCAIVCLVSIYGQQISAFLGEILATLQAMTPVPR